MGVGDDVGVDVAVGVGEGAGEVVFDGVAVAVTVSLGLGVGAVVDTSVGVDVGAGLEALVDDTGDSPAEDDVVDAGARGASSGDALASVYTSTNVLGWGSAWPPHPASATRRTTAPSRVRCRMGSPNPAGADRSPESPGEGSDR